MELKKCPYCGKTVLAIAKSCKHCGKSFEARPVEEAKPVEEVKTIQDTKPVLSVPPVPAPPPPKAAEPVYVPPAQHPVVDPKRQQKFSPKIMMAVIAALAALVVLVVIVVNTLSGKKEVEQTEPVASTNYIEPVVEETVSATGKETKQEEKAPKTNSNPPVRYASIKGKSVIFRESYSTTSNKLGYLNENEQVVILSEYFPSNTNEAISNKVIKLYNSSGMHTYTLPVGKAVKVIGSDGDKCDVSFVHPQYGNLSATIYRSDIDFISGDKWYSIKRHTGETGWVFSKFVKLN